MSKPARWIDVYETGGFLDRHEDDDEKEDSDRRFSLKTRDKTASA
jgi:hypothetical protein